MDVNIQFYSSYVIYGTRKNEDGTVKTPDPNLRFWDVSSGQLLATVIADKQVLFVLEIKFGLNILGGMEAIFYGG